VRSGDPVTAALYGQEFTVSAGSEVTFPGQYRASDGLAPGSSAAAAASAGASAAAEAPGEPEGSVA